MVSVYTETMADKYLLRLQKELEKMYIEIRALKSEQDRKLGDLQTKMVHLFKEISQSLPMEARERASHVHTDDLYPDAQRLVIQAGAASASYLQRTLEIGYARAEHLMDMLEEHGVIGPADGAKPREIRLTPGAQKVLQKIELQLKGKRQKNS